jgi:hypothetical protein
MRATAVRDSGGRDRQQAAAMDGSDPDISDPFRARFVRWEADTPEDTAGRYGRVHERTMNGRLTLFSWTS